MSSRFGVQQRPASHGRAGSRGRFQSGFVPASADTASVLPADRAGSVWLVNVGGTDTVEMTGDEIAQAWREGRLERQTLVWRQGLLEWTALCTVPQLSLALDRLRSVRGAAPDDISEEDLTELWAPPVADAAPRLPPSASFSAIRSEPERLPEDEVTELWASGQASRQSLDDPPPPLSPYDSELERLPEDEVTQLWDSRPPDLAAIEAASLEGIDDAPSLTFEEIEYDDEQLAEDEVTTLWAEHKLSGLAPMDRAPRLSPTVPLRNASQQSSARFADRLTQPSMARIAEMRGRVASQFAPPQPFVRTPGITTLAFWADGVRGLYELVSTRLEWVVDAVIRVAEHRGGAARQAEGFQSRTAVFLTEMRTALMDAILSAFRSLGQWTARITDRASGRKGRYRC